jgi:hypothetical protein
MGELEYPRFGLTPHGCARRSWLGIVCCWLGVAADGELAKL